MKANGGLSAQSALICLLAGCLILLSCDREIGVSQQILKGWSVVIRIEYDGAFYQVMARGNRRECIFRGEADRLLFYQTLGEALGLAEGTRGS